MPAKKSGRALSWSGDYGAAFAGQVHVEFSHTEKPYIPGIDMELIEYAPDEQCYQVKESGRDWRRMTRAECAVVDNLLGQMGRAGKSVWVKP